MRNGCIQGAQREDSEDSETEELTAYFDDDDEDDITFEEGEDVDVVFEAPKLVELHRPRMDPNQANDPMGEIEGTVEKHDSSDFTHSVIGSVNRNIMMKHQRESQGDLGDEESDDEDVVFKKPRLIEPHRPRMNPNQANNLTGKIRRKIKTFDSSNTKGI